MKKIALCVIASALIISSAKAVSLQNLIDQNKIPSARLGVLNLSYMDIDSLEGIDNLNLQGVQILRLAGNNLRRLPAGSFRKATEIRALDLSNNKIEEVDPNAFIGLRNLWVLVLSGNNIETLSPKITSSMPRLKILALYNNPMSAEELRSLQKKSRRVRVYNWPITREYLKKAGVVAAGVVALALAAVGLTYGLKKSKKGEAGEEIKKSEEYPETLKEFNIDEAMNKINRFEQDPGISKEVKDYLDTLALPQQLAFIGLPLVVQRAMAMPGRFENIQPSLIAALWERLSEEERERILTLNPESIEQSLLYPQKEEGREIKDYLDTLDTSQKSAFKKLPFIIQKAMATPGRFEGILPTTIEGEWDMFSSETKREILTLSEPEEIEEALLYQEGLSEKEFLSKDKKLKKFKASLVWRQESVKDFFNKLSIVEQFKYISLPTPIQDAIAVDATLLPSDIKKILKKLSEDERRELLNLNEAAKLKYFHEKVGY